MAAKATRRRTKKWPKIKITERATAAEILANLNLTPREQRLVRAAVDEAMRATSAPALRSRKTPRRRAAAK